MNTRSDYLSNLDLLRFLAALWVVGTHYGYIGPSWGVVPYAVPDNAWSSFFKYGYLGVPVFFTLSGFLIAHVSQSTDGVRFAANRVLRLMPGFWSSMTLSALVLAILGTPWGISFGQWAANLILLPQVLGKPFVDGVYWTLVYEFVFYGWAVILIFAGVFHRHMLAIASAWLAISTLNMFVLQSGILERLLITNFSGSFIAGLVLWHGRKHAFTAFHWLLMAATIIFLGFGVQVMDTQDFLPTYSGGHMGYWQALAFGAFTVGVVALGIFAPQLGDKRKILMTLGAISYPLYLIHQEIGYAILRHVADLAHPALLATVLAVLMVLASWALHTFAEKPLRKALQRIVTPLVDKVADFTLQKAARA